MYMYIYIYVHLYMYMYTVLVYSPVPEYRSHHGVAVGNMDTRLLRQCNNHLGQCYSITMFNSINLCFKNTAKHIIVYSTHTECCMLGRYAHIIIYM